MRCGTLQNSHKMAVPFWRGWSELLQEPFVVLEDQPQVADLEVAHGEAFQTHAEGEAGILVRINAAVAQHLGVHHAGAQHFDPALALAGGAARAVALVALDIHFAARLGERKMMRAEARDRVLAVELAHDLVERALEIRHRNALVDGHALDLVEHGRVRGVDFILAVDATSAG